MKKFLLVFLCSLIFSAVTLAAPKTFAPDPDHSGVNFEIRYFFTPINGSFGGFDASVVYDESDLSNSSVTASIDVSTIDTNNADRDEHLQNDDFFNAPVNPEISFESTSWIKKGANEFTVEGNLSMAGQTKPVTLDVTLLGTRENDDGVLVSAWEATTTLDRRDWGITYGQGVVGNEVTVEISMDAPEA